MLIFLKHLSDYIQICYQEDFIILGDFNTCIHDIDRRTLTAYHYRQTIIKLQEIIENY